MDESRDIRRNFFVEDEDRLRSPWCRGRVLHVEEGVWLLVWLLVWPLLGRNIQVALVGIGKGAQALRHVLLVFLRHMAPVI